MSSHKRNICRSLALALCLGVMGASGAPAMADPSQAIIEDQPTSLTIHKYEGIPIDPPAGCSFDAGVELDPSCLTSLQIARPVTFWVTPVFMPGTTDLVDLTTNEGWDAANAYYNNVSLAAQNLDTDNRVTGRTNSSTGEVTLSNLDVGLYYVKELPFDQAYTLAEPFLVTLPMTQPTDRDSWMYDVHVYPKNAGDYITKEVVDKGSVLSDEPGAADDAGTVTYTLTSTITDGLTAAQMGKYVIKDKLTGNVTFGINQNDGVSVALSDGTDLIRDVHYTLNFSGNEFTIFMLPAGLTLLADNSELEVITTVEVDQQAIPGYPNTTSFTNKAYLFPSVLWERGRPNGYSSGIHSNAVYTHYGHRKITKVDGNDNNITLAGAEFTVYADGNNDELCTDADIIEANKLVESTYDSNENEYIVNGLQSSDFYNNETQSDLLTYCLAETKAPEGYNLLAEPVKFHILTYEHVGIKYTYEEEPGTGEIIVTATEAENMVVANQKSNLSNSLPLTGGAGTDDLAVGLGLLALLGGGYYAVAAKRRREDEEADVVA